MSSGKIRKEDVVRVAVKYGEREISYDLDLEIPLEQHVASLCQQFAIIGSPYLYGLQPTGSLTCLDAKELRRSTASRFTGANSWELKLLPSSQFVAEVVRCVEDLQSNEETREKRACYVLQQQMKAEPRFAQEFMARNGVSYILKVIQKSKGNTLSYGLRAVQTYMALTDDFKNLPTSFMEKLVACITDSNLNVSKIALNIVNELSRPGAANRGAMIFIGNRRERLPVAELVRMLGTHGLHGDVTLLHEALCLLANLAASAATPSTSAAAAAAAAAASSGTGSSIIVPSSSSSPSPSPAASSNPAASAAAAAGGNAASSSSASASSSSSLSSLSAAAVPSSSAAEPQAVEQHQQQQQQQQQQQTQQQPLGSWLMGQLEAAGIGDVLPQLLASNSEAVRAQLLRFQHCQLLYWNRERLVTFDESNAEHADLLRRLWAAVFPERPWQGPVGDHWKAMGFQGKNPTTDLRAMGVMGLRHLVYLAETHPLVLRQMVARQAARDAELQYPVATAGITVSQLLFDSLRAATTPPPAAPPVPGSSSSSSSFSAAAAAASASVSAALSSLPSPASLLASLSGGGGSGGQQQQQHQPPVSFSSSSVVGPTATAPAATSAASPPPAAPAVVVAGGTSSSSSSPPPPSSASSPQPSPVVSSSSSASTSSSEPPGSEADRHQQPSNSSSYGSYPATTTGTTVTGGSSSTSLPVPPVGTAAAAAAADDSSSSSSSSSSLLLSLVSTVGSPHPVLLLPNAYLELYCIVFQLLDRKWLQYNAGYMEFQQVLAEVRAQFESMLERRLRSLADFRAAAELDRPMSSSHPRLRTPPLSPSPSSASLGAPSSPATGAAGRSAGGGGGKRGSGGDRSGAGVAAAGTTTTVSAAAAAAGASAAGAVLFVCDRCEAAAVLSCEQCQLPFCAECAAEMHQKREASRWREHRLLPLPPAPADTGRGNAVLPATADSAGGQHQQQDDEASPSQRHRRGGLQLPAPGADLLDLLCGSDDTVAAAANGSGSGSGSGSDLGVGVAAADLDNAGGAGFPVESLGASIDAPDAVAAAAAAAGDDDDRARQATAAASADDESPRQRQSLLPAPSLLPDDVAAAGDRRGGELLSAAAAVVADGDGSSLLLPPLLQHRPSAAFLQRPAPLRAGSVVEEEEPPPEPDDVFQEETPDAVRRPPQQNGNAIPVVSHVSDSPAAAATALDNAELAAAAVSSPAAPASDTPTAPADGSGGASSTQDLQSMQQPASTTAHRVSARLSSPPALASGAAGISTSSAPASSPAVTVVRSATVSSPSPPAPSSASIATAASSSSPAAAFFVRGAPSGARGGSSSSLLTAAASPVAASPARAARASVFLGSSRQAASAATGPETAAGAPVVALSAAVTPPLTPPPTRTPLGSPLPQESGRMDGVASPWPAVSLWGAHAAASPAGPSDLASGEMEGDNGADSGGRMALVSATDRARDLLQRSLPLATSAAVLRSAGSSPHPSPPPSPLAVPSADDSPRSGVGSSSPSSVRHFSRAYSAGATEGSADEARARRLRLQQEAIKEIISTEIDYISDLEVVLEVFLFPIKIQKVMPESDTQILFSNIETIHNCNSQLLAEWKVRSTTASGQDAIIALGEIFQKMSPFFKMYTVYCANQPKAMDLLTEYMKRPDFVSTLRICETDPKCRGLSLHSFLIKPIQRICKYPLLFRELLKLTDPEERERFTTLENACQVLESVTSTINVEVRNAEKLNRVFEIQKSIDGSGADDLVTVSRRFVREGSLLVDSQESYVFLFNDLCLLTKQRSGSVAKKERYELKYKLSVHDMILVDITSSQNFEVSSGKRKFLFQFSSEADKMSWLQEIKQLRRAWLLEKTKQK